MSGTETSNPQLMLFVVGNSRSGTTMLGRILGNNPAVFTFHELHFFEELWSPQDQGRLLSAAEAEGLAAQLLDIQRGGYLSTRSTQVDGEARRVIAALPPAARNSAQLYRSFLFYEAQQHQKSVPCEQTPRNVFYISELLELFPGAKIINMVRDPRDVLLSQKRKWKRRFFGATNIPLREASRSWINYHPIIISKLWNAAIRAAGQHEGNKRLLTLRFEDILQDPEGQTRRLCQFLGLTYDENMLEIPQVGSSRALDNPLKKGINRNFSGNWRNGGLTPSEIFICQRITSPFLKQYRYEDIETLPVNPFGLVFCMITFIGKIGLALISNLRRMKNIRETLKRRLK
jgi:omega-hydroxy-beta-dihydromenaquinone-9 sulfotransferase